MTEPEENSIFLASYEEDKRKLLIHELLHKMYGHFQGEFEKKELIYVGWVPIWLDIFTPDSYDRDD